MNKNFIIVLTLFISCNSNIINSNNEEIVYNPEISIKKGDENINIIIHDYPVITGFQFDLSQSENLNIISLQVSGGVSEEHDFHIATSINNLRILGFSLTELAIPQLSQDSSILITLQIEYEGNGDIGLSNVIFSGENGTEIEISTNPQTINLP